LDPTLDKLEQHISLEGMLGYINFSEGKADRRFESDLNKVYGLLVEAGSPEPWNDLFRLLRAKLGHLTAEFAGTFRQSQQAERVLDLVFRDGLPGYRRFHADLLHHLSDGELFSPFFLARFFEATLSQGPPWEEVNRIVEGTLRTLNDFVGLRPIAVLETRPDARPYPHEFVRPIPLFIKGVGTGTGKYHDLVELTLEILRDTDPALLFEAGFSLDALEELALDPRSYDQGHPINSRPNYIFGEWDPHHLDDQWRYSRFVVRRITLIALLDRIDNPGALDGDEALSEAAVVLAGTILMAAGISGESPTAHDSSSTLSVLRPRVARYRDTFYAEILKATRGNHGERLRQEAMAGRQPFGHARQHLNQFLARDRAFQLQERHLALMFADMGYAEVSRREAARIEALTARFLSEILGRLSTGHLLVDRGDLTGGAAVLPEAEELLRRGIACGGLADPWNILGFHGVFPLASAQEDAVRDTRIDDLLLVMENLFNLYSRLMSEAAATGITQLLSVLDKGLEKLAGWWSQFASTEIGDVQRVHAGETLDSARHVARALALWHGSGQGMADLRFWKENLEGFRSAKAFALVIDALLRKGDYRAAMGLLISWLGQAENVSLEETHFSFSSLAIRWMLGVTQLVVAEQKDLQTNEESGTEAATHGPLIVKFFEHIEANADEYWQVPTFQFESPAGEDTDPADQNDRLYGAAYEDVTYRDSADDNQAGPISDGAGSGVGSSLEQEQPILSKRLRFLSTLAQLWQIAGLTLMSAGQVDRRMQQALGEWLRRAEDNLQHLLGLVDSLHSYPVPEPSGGTEFMVEYDQRRALHESVVYAAIATCLDTYMAAGSLRGTQSSKGDLGPATGPAPGPAGKAGIGDPGWERHALTLEQALWKGDASLASQVLPVFFASFGKEPLLFTALADGGQPQQILRVRIAQSILRALAINLPRLGLLRETYQLLALARQMEHAQRPSGRTTTEFSFLFQAGFQAFVECLVGSAARWGPTGDRALQLVALLDKAVNPFLKLWGEQSQTMHLSTLELVEASQGWDSLGQFIRDYGGDLFDARFLTVANLRGILHRGVGPYLDVLRDNPDPLHPVRLLESPAVELSRENAISMLETILRIVVENYEEYKDYNRSTGHSDYGENLYVLLDFLRLKAIYDRRAWQLRPLCMVHEVLARQNQTEAAQLWEASMTNIVTDLSRKILLDLDRLEEHHGIRLRTVRDHLEERFVRPLAIDRLCAFIKPAMEEAANGGGSALAALQSELTQQSNIPVGVGLDVPTWIRRLEQEVNVVRAKRSRVAVMADSLLTVPKKWLSRDEIGQLMEGFKQSTDEKQMRPPE
jgi:hypothetical protein